MSNLGTIARVAKILARAISTESNRLVRDGVTL